MAKQTTREVLLLFKAQGTFQGSKPGPNSPYQTAGPFFSSSILGQQIWPGNTSIEDIHHRLSSSLNDRHNKIGIIGDWRDTHSSQYYGYWSFYWERFERIKVPGEKATQRLIDSDRQTSENYRGG